MIRRLLAAALLLVTALLVASRRRPAAAEPEPVDLVRPFVGTQNYGNTFPGASAPFGMVQVSPDTGGQGGYDYEQNIDLRLQPDAPVRRRLRRGRRAADHADHRRGRPAPTTNAYKSPFAHDDEEASPGYYRVGLPKYDIDAELTATARTGWQRYTFPATDAANVLFNTGKANQTVFDSEIHVVGDRTVEGRVHAGNFCAGKDDHTVYFSASFDRPFAALRHLARRRRSPPAAGTRRAPAATARCVTFDATRRPRRGGQGRAVLHRPRTARGRTWPRRPRDAYDFDAVRAALRAQWVGRARPDQDRRRYGRAAAPPSTPRCTTRCCTRTWPATSTAGTSASTARCTPPTGTRRTRTSRCGTPTARRTSCSSCSRRTSPGTWRCRCWRSAGTAAGCRAGRWPTARPTS